MARVELDLADREFRLRGLETRHLLPFLSPLVIWCLFGAGYELDPEPPRLVFFHKDHVHEIAKKACQRFELRNSSLVVEMMNQALTSLIGSLISAVDLSFRGLADTEERWASKLVRELDHAIKAVDNDQIDRTAGRLDMDANQLKEMVKLMESVQTAARLHASVCAIAIRNAPRFSIIKAAFVQEMANAYTAAFARPPGIVCNKKTGARMGPYSSFVAEAACMLLNRIPVGYLPLDVHESWTQILRSLGRAETVAELLRFARRKAKIDTAARMGKSRAMPD